MKRIFFTLILLSMFSYISAQTYYAEIDGITYYLVKSYDDTDIGYATVMNNGGNYCGHIQIPNYVEYEGISYQVSCINMCAFKNCHDLVSIELPSTPNFHIAAQAFANSGLEEIIIPGNVNFLGVGAFAYCRNLKKVEFQFSYQDLKVSYGEPKGCDNIVADDSVMDEFVPEEADRYYNTLFYYSRVDHLIIDRYLRRDSYFDVYSTDHQQQHKEIGDTHLVEYSTIERYEPLFYGIDIDYERVEIGAYWFSDNASCIKRCWSMKRPQIIVVLYTIPPKVIDREGGNEGFEVHTLYVPADALDRYKADPYWSQFPNIFPVEEYTGVDSIHAAICPFKIDGNVILFNQPSNEYHIYDINGKVISSGNADGAVTLDQKGVYIVMVGKQAFKIII